MKIEEKRVVEIDGEKKRVNKEDIKSEFVLTIGDDEITFTQKEAENLYQELKAALNIIEPGTLPNWHDIDPHFAYPLISYDIKPTATPCFPDVSFQSNVLPVKSENKEGGLDA